VLASPLAIGTAAAAPVNQITIDPAPAPVPSTSPATATATVTATYTPASPAPTDIMYAVTAGGDISGSGGLAGTACTANAGTITCNVANTSKAPTTDTVKIFEDTGTTPGQLDGGDVLATPTSGVTVTFSGAPTALSFTTAPTSGTAGTCTNYTVHASRGGSGALAGSQPLTLTVTESSSTNPGGTPITLFPTGCTNGGSTTTGNNVTGTGPYSNTYTHSLTTDANGDVTFGIQTSTPGTGTVKVSVPSDPSTSTATVAVTWSAGGSDAVTAVNVTPGSTTQLTGTTASFTVTATNGGAPVQGVAVKGQTTSGPDTTVNCGTTNSSGQTTCTVHNGGTAGADALTFWVDNASGACSHTGGPDSCEPKTTATATFTAAPAVSAANSTLTCVQQLSGADKGAAKTDCTVPTSQNSVTFTATVKDASGNPIANAPVTFTATAAKLGGTTLTGSNLPASATTNTNANGVATYVVNDPSAANGDSVTVNAAVGATSIGTATAHWVAPAADGLTVVPQLQTVTEGGTVTVKATVVDQFGNPVSGSPNITYFVSGRNNAKTGTAAADGTITYTDAGTVPGQKTDTIQVTDNTNHFTATPPATVKYVTGSTSADTVTVDTSGLGTTDATCAAAGHSAAADVSLQGTTEVCAVVKNATGEALAGKTVTFTVSSGQVAAHGGLTASSGTTYQATTDANGVAFADVTSTKSGAQTVTATADGKSGTGTVTYKTAALATAYTIALAPASPTVAPGSTQKFTATVTDKFGNPVSGVSVTFTQSGPGSLGGASSQSVTTGADGTAAVTLATAASDTGSGSVTATIATAGTQCASAPTGTPASKCSAQTTYTVGNTATPSSITLEVEHGAKAGTHESVTATVKNSDGTPAANQVVRFFVTGKNTASGSATTDVNGQARIAYEAPHHGTDHITAYVDSNNNQIREANEPKSETVTAHIKGREHPELSLNSKNGKVKIHVDTRPNAKHALVRYYVKRHGSWDKIGSSHTNRHGNDHHKFAFKVGSHHKFRAKVSATPVTTKGTSNAASIRVRG
jgi:adhesin/invasin